MFNVLLFQSCCFWCLGLMFVWFGNLFAVDVAAWVCVALVLQVSIFAMFLLVVVVLISVVMRCGLFCGWLLGN